jgi:hypothetical protein
MANESSESSGQLTPKCRECRFFKRMGVGMNECRRRSPVLVAGMMSMDGSKSESAFRVWPEVFPSDLCGEFEWQPEPELEPKPAPKSEPEPRSKPETRSCIDVLRSLQVGERALWCGVVLYHLTDLDYIAEDESRGRGYVGNIQDVAACVETWMRESSDKPKKDRRSK